MSMLKIAGVNDGNEARGIKTDENGLVKTRHIWETDQIYLFNDQEIRSTSAIWSDTIDVSEYAIVSLRVYNNMNKPATIRFGSDLTPSNTSYLYDKDGTSLSLNINNDSKIEMITPEDFPALHYLKRIRIRASCEESPTSGSLTVIVFGRR